MRLALLVFPLLLVGCSQQTPEEKEAAKYNAPKMLSDSEAQKVMGNDPRKGGPRPTVPGETR